MEITEHYFKTPRHETFYLAAGNEDDPLIYLIRGWPDLSLGWVKQIGFLAQLGYRVIAPDMRGYGRSTIHLKNSDYCCLLYTSPSPRDRSLSRMPSSA